MKEQAEIPDINLLKDTIFDLPNSVILKIINNSIDLKNYKIRKEALNTLSKCLSLFILYITDGALEHCENEKRFTIFVRDILNSLNDSLFLDIYDQLKTHVAIQEENNKKTTSNNNSGANATNKDTEGEQNNENPKENDDFDILLQALE
ncbi:CCAAT-binding transcription factor, putative [Plasmodium berghei]|uniref:CCAAT-binding transcription factor, putative n=2 Tax=Plasmodium berghei TaxID=5821 RepID=A0A509AQ23_PLABA|nr:CCAAT-binding transcription factor, putative [Plasmodium berghei ANKA]CXJ11401.1 CCAAT-binding transcription factor, putative [Plasmodium berghei]SCM26018.1 CCAAT-binding transcription factor, putative [Plasmodium berghei]SCN28236.1 CCAAT-binding transcription factor, putative [Plasmodium berghei]SCO62434.1 CCAAT-binding transcription factor, putative [Plasmodium berghei]SCO63992.1 CCAAT-binding transcription factor, putative [Plasmodium berghei]|eukprot:XP_034423888.1 CCAAT-binding transcription factor, putative [Plasmodium berghei ANKA]